MTKLRRCLILSATIVALLATVVVKGQEEVAAAEIQDDTEQMQPVSEQPIKLVHVLNPGEREYLSPNLIGVQNIAMTYLPLSMNFVNIIDAFREIVDGVRYEIILNAVDTKANDEAIICRLVILERPWLRTEWGDKMRELQHSNCTSDVDNLTDPAAKNRALSDKYESNSLFNGGKRNEISNDEMAKLVDQIMAFGAGHSAVTKKRTETRTSTSTSSTTASIAPKEDIEQAANTTPAAADETAATTAEPTELSDDEKKWLDDILSVGAINFENSRQHSNKQDNRNTDQNSENVADGENNYVKRRILNEQQYQDYSTQREQEEEEEVRDHQQVEPEMEKFESTHTRSKRGTNQIPGGVSELEADEAKERLKNSLDKIGAPNYKIGKIYSATTQVVSGSLTKIDADLIDSYEKSLRCNIDIWAQPWLENGHEVTINCPGKEQIKKRHSRSVENAEKKTHKKHAHHEFEKSEHLFNKYQMKFNKRYHNTMERQMRLRIFRQNLKTIGELNQNEMGSAKYGITEFADMTSSEYKERTGLWQREADKPSKHPLAQIPDIELPKEFDWREKGVISEVKNQGSCGSCWAFSVTGNIEGLHAVKTGQLEEYSEQELLDCDTIDSACNGGLPDNAYEAIQKIGGLELESEYPYQGRKDQCHFDRNLAHVQVKGAVDLPKNETAMAQWLMANGPISIGINANAMQFYRGGVSHPWRPLCSHSNLDHGVLIVGFGVSDYPMFKKTLPYWIVKNSWGKKWGEQGYYRVYRGDNTCGVGEMATSAVLA